MNEFKDIQEDIKKNTSPVEIRHMTIAESMVMDQTTYWSQIYELNFQFWPEQNNVFIAKDGIDLKDFGGYENPYEAMKACCLYLQDQNPKAYRFYLDNK